MRAVFDLVDDDELASWFGCSRDRIRATRKRYGMRRTTQRIRKHDGKRHSEATEFKKGARPTSAHKPGEVWSREEKGRLVKMIAMEQGKPVPYARWMWERDNGKVPPGYFVTLVDGDPQNVTPGNLALISRADNARRNGRCDAKARAAKIWATRRKNAAYRAAKAVYVDPFKRAA